MSWSGRVVVVVVVVVVSCLSSGCDTGTVLFGHDHEREGGAAEGWEMESERACVGWVG